MEPKADDIVTVISRNDSQDDEGRVYEVVEITPEHASLRVIEPHGPYVGRVIVFSRQAWSINVRISGSLTR